MSATPPRGIPHPVDEFVPYLLDELDPMARAAVDGHLDRCASCREELVRLEAGLVATVEALPPTAPSDGVWAAIAARLAAEPVGAPARTGAAAGVDRVPAAPRRAGRWATGGLVASLALAAALGVWGVGQRQVALEVRADLAAARAAAAARTGELLQAVDVLEADVGARAAEQERIAAWLAGAGVTVAAIEGAGDAVGAVLYRTDGAALVVMRDAPAAGRSLQAWGVAGGEVTSLGAFEGRVLEVPTDGFEAVAISIEPLGGSATPTEVLGAAPRS